jgi:hypothetical protein
MSDNRALYIEEAITGAVKKLLNGKVNDVLRGLEFQIPIIEFGIFRGDTVIAPLVSLSSCEQTEKERIIKQDTYSITVTFPVLDTVESEFYCYAYAAAFQKVLCEDLTLGGVADRAVITSKKYVPPKKADCGMEWETIITLRVTVDSL